MTAQEAAARPARRWLLHIAEGQRYDRMVRIAQFALALAEHDQVQLDFQLDEAVAPWRLLLSGPEQLRLRALAQDPGSGGLQHLLHHAERLRDALPGSADWAQANARLADQQAQTLWCRSGAVLPPPPVGAAWLVLFSQPTAAAQSLSEAYPRGFYWDAQQQAPRGRITPLRPAVTLPPQTEATPPQAPPRLLLIGGPETRRGVELAHWAQACGADPCLFDPYFSAAHYAEQGLPAAITYLGAGDAAHRRRAYQGAQAVLSVDGPDFDDHFVCEAEAAGLPRLRPTPAANAGTWDAALLAAAWRSLDAATTAPIAAAAKPDWTDWLQALRRVGPAALQPPAKTWPLGPHRLTLAASPEAAAAAEAMALAAAEAPPPPPLLLLRPGRDTTWNPNWRPLWWDAAGIWVDTQDNAHFVVDMVAAMLPPPLQLYTDLAAALQAMLQRPTGQAIYIIHLGNDDAALAETERLLAGLVAGNGTALPVLALHSVKRIAAQSLSNHGIGAAVASQTVATGLDHAALGRCEVRWLGRQRPNSDRGRLYLYPHAPGAGMHGDELDYAALPEALSQGRIDVLCCLDPFLVGGTSARALWARQATPLVGMLHSVHSAAGSTEAIVQLMSGPQLRLRTPSSRRASAAARPTPSCWAAPTSGCRARAPRWPPTAATWPCCPTASRAATCTAYAGLPAAWPTTCPRRRSSCWLWGASAGRRRPTCCPCCWPCVTCAAAPCRCT